MPCCFSVTSTRRRCSFRFIILVIIHRGPLPVVRGLFHGCEPTWARIPRGLDNQPALAAARGILAARFHREKTLCNAWKSAGLEGIPAAKPNQSGDPQRPSRGQVLAPGVRQISREPNQRNRVRSTNMSELV